MKKHYIAPLFSLILIQDEDVISTSNGRPGVANEETGDRFGGMNWVS